MQKDALFKLSGLAAILGGMLDIFRVFPILTDPIAREWLYTAIDILLVFGLIGVYLLRAEKLALLGLASFTVTMAGLSFIGGPDADTFGFSTGEQGMAVIAIGMVGFSIAWLRASEKPIAPPLCWFGSVVAAGALGMLPAPFPDYALKAATILFGAGFMLAGVQLIRR